MHLIYRILFLFILSFGLYTNEAHAFENPVKRGFVIGSATVGIAGVSTLAGGLATVAVHGNVYDSIVVGIAVGGIVTPIGAMLIAPSLGSDSSAVLRNTAISSVISSGLCIIAYLAVKEEWSEMLFIVGAVGLFVVTPIVTGLTASSSPSETVASMPPAMRFSPTDSMVLSPVITTEYKGLMVSFSY